MHFNLLLNSALCLGYLRVLWWHWHTSLEELLTPLFHSSLIYGSVFLFFINWWIKWWSKHHSMTCLTAMSWCTLVFCSWSALYCTIAWLLLGTETGVTVIPSPFQVVHHGSPISPGCPATVMLIMVSYLPPSDLTSVCIHPHATWLYFCIGFFSGLVEIMNLHMKY